MLRIPDWLRYEIQRRWEQIAVRKWINNNPRLIIGVTAASVFVFLIIAIGYLMPPETINVEEYEKGWFYDLNTGELFVARAELAGPIEAPSGPLPDGKPAGIKAYVFSYVSEPNESERFIGFLEMPDPETEKDSSIEAEADSRENWLPGKLIRRVDDKQWVPANSNQGQAILNEVFRVNENGRRLDYCPPE